MLQRFTLPAQDPVLVFGICMALILLAPALFRRLRVPGIMGLIVAGMLVGPNALGLLERSETIVLLGTVGLLYIMFLAGLDINLTQFNRYRNRSLVFGVLTFSIPQVAGTLIFLWMGFSWAAAILIASMFASHTLVAYPVASRLGISRNPAVTTAVGGTILTDTVALLVLAVVARSVQGELDLPFWLTLGSLFTLYVAGVILLLPRLARWFFRNVQDGAPAEFAFILATVFLCSWLAKAIGTEAIIGAFLAGLTLNRMVPENGPLMGRIQFFGDAFIIPFFLLYIGMLVDPSVLTSGAGAWVVMGTMLGAVLVTKWMAAALTQRIFGYSSEEGKVIFGLSVAQAAATLAATLVGYDLGIFGDDVLNGVILMIFVTCVMAPWVVERYGRVVALRQASEPLDPEEAPERVLVPVARPASGDGLLDVAFAIRGTNGESVYPLFVVPRGSPKLVADGEAMLGHAVRYAAAAEIPLLPLTRVDSSVASAVARAVEEERIATVVAGWNGARSAEQRIFGTVLDQMLDQVGTTLLVCKLEQPLNTHSGILLLAPPGAGAEPGFPRAVRVVKRLAASLGIPIRVVVGSQDGDGVVQALERVRPHAVVQREPLEGWGSLMGHLESRVRPGDLLVLLSARPGGLSWHSAMDTLPRGLARVFPESSFITLYPGQAADQEGVHAIAAADAMGG